MSERTSRPPRIAIAIMATRGWLRAQPDRADRVVEHRLVGRRDEGATRAEADPDRAHVLAEDRRGCRARGRQRAGRDRTAAAVGRERGPRTSTICWSAGRTPGRRSCFRNAPTDSAATILPLRATGLNRTPGCCGTIPAISVPVGVIGGEPEVRSAPDVVQQSRAERCSPCSDGRVATGSGVLRELHSTVVAAAVLSCAHETSAVDNVTASC